jgi:hypothetical protein
MRHFILSVKLLTYGFLAYLLYVLAVEYDPANTAFHPPFVLFVVDWINLFIHEAGHLFFKIFGEFVYLLGGSLTQILLPALLVVVTWRQSRMRGVGLPLFWTGENMVNVSVYIRDAPFKKLHLIAGGLIHDWNWLLNGDPDAAEIISDAVFGLGLLLCAGAIAVGVWSAVAVYREAEELDREPVLPTPKSDFDVRL